MDEESNPLVVLIGDGGKRHLARCGQGMKEIPGLGVIDTSRLRDALVDLHITLAGKDFAVLEASLADVLGCMKRGAQIIMPKDAAQILMGCCIGPGDSVMEVGTGSAFLTVVLAHSVGPAGKVVTYEMNPKHARNAQSNIRLAGYEQIVELREADAATCTDVDSYHAITMDMPEPWAMLDIVAAALKTGGYACAYVPTMNQAEAAIKAMRDSGFADTHVLENIQREIVVGPGGTRPSFEMLGHTGYLCFGRKVKR